MRQTAFHAGKVRSSPSAARCAFTLIELLVVLASLGLLAATCLPVLAKTRPQGFSCLNNQRQLLVAAAMYSSDTGKLVLNPGGAPTGPGADGLYPTWVAGWLDWLTGNSFAATPNSNTNLDCLLKTPFGQYTAKNPGLYKCPADKIPGATGARVRSISMNAFIGGSFMTQSGGVGPHLTTYRSYLKESDLAVPGPSKLWIFTDEHPDSINDGFFQMNLPSSANWPAAVPWQDSPASYHNGACGFGFCDGHVEMKQWSDAITLAPIGKIHPAANYGKISPHDNPWMLQRTTAPR